MFIFCNVLFFINFIVYVKKSLLCCFEHILINHNLCKQSSIGGYLGRVHLNENVIRNYYVFMSVPMHIYITIHIYCAYYSRVCMTHISFVQIYILPFIFHTKILGFITLLLSLSNTFLVLSLKITGLLIHS